MDITIYPGKLTGTVSAIPSKSQAHRLLICAAFSDRETKLICPETNQDIEATASCLRALGAEIERTEMGYKITPVKTVPEYSVLDCNESGSTLRFLLPVVAALGVKATFQMSGRLPYRPLSPLWEELEAHGCILTRPTENTISICGKLSPGVFYMDGSVSSQYITGLLFAMALMEGRSRLNICGKCESVPYIQMTQAVLKEFGIDTDAYTVRGKRPFISPGTIHVEGDWSNGAFYLAAKFLGNDVTVTGLAPDSTQGDRACAQILPKMDREIIVNAADIPDLVPILAITAGAMQGATFTNISRLRLKESDRVETVISVLRSLGTEANATENELKVFPGKYRGCTVDAAGDHRIAMAAGIAATVANSPVTILGAQCVAKSYPSFWEEYRRLGGNYEQHLR